MKISKSAMDAAVAEGILSHQQASQLRAFLQRQPGVGPVFNLTHVLYYLGGLVAIGAMTLFISLGVMLVRRVFVVFGALGSCYYLGYLAHSVFEDSLIFPFALTAIGLGVIYLGVVWQKHEQQLTEQARRLLPAPLRELLDSKAS